MEIAIVICFIYLHFQHIRDYAVALNRMFLL